MVVATNMWRILVIISVTLIGVAIADNSSGIGEADPSAASTDFGGMTSVMPSAFKTASTVDDVAEIVKSVYKAPNLTLAARGNGHSLNGQAMADRGIVIDMQSVGPHTFEIVQLNGTSYLEVPGGALWQDILGFCLSKGLSPRTFTDYLNLTVGGTVSNAGVGGHAFRYGPQAVNVGQLEVVTGKGKVVVCSEDQNPELFRGVLGGLGQFGVITKAWIRLHEAPDMAVWIRVLYTEFEEFTRDAEFLIGREEGETFDYVEGFVIPNNQDPVSGLPSVPMYPMMRTSVDSTMIPKAAGPVLYCLEVALHYKNGIEEEERADLLTSKLLGGMKFEEGLVFQAKVKYEEYLLRVNREVAAAAPFGTWEAPHPWLNMFISKDNIPDFDRLVYRTLLQNGVNGRILLYPLVRSRWGNDTSLVIPQSGGDIFYFTSILRFNPAYPIGPPLEDLIAQNNEVLRICNENNLDYKLYLSNFPSQKEWIQHFGNQWEKFAERKACFDPKGILAPGQNIFTQSSDKPGRGVCALF